MNLFQGSWLPKVFGAIALLAGLSGQVFPQYAAISAPIAALAGYLVAHVTRQDNKSSEQVGAGNTGEKKR